MGIMLRFCMYLLEIEIDIEIISVVVYTHMQNDSIESHKGNVGPLKVSMRFNHHCPSQKIDC